jgi:hypothetical protein
VTVPTPTVTPSAQPTFNALDYGAHADGAGDNYTAVQNAMNAASAAGGGVVYLPAGTYRFTRGKVLPNIARPVMKVNVAVPANVTLAGAGIGKTIVVGASAENGINVIGSMSNNVGVRDLTETVDAADQPSTWKDGIKLCKVDGATITNVRVENNYLGMNLIGCSNVTVTGCTAYNARTGYMVDMQADFWTSDTITFSYCEAARTNDPNGGIPYGWALYADSGDDTHRLRNITLDHCYSHDNENGGIYSKWTDRLTVTNCRIENNGWAFYVINTKDFYSAGNTATGNSNDALAYNGGNSNLRP